MSVLRVAFLGDLRWPLEFTSSLPIHGALTGDQGIVSIFPKHDVFLPKDIYSSSTNHGKKPRPANEYNNNHFDFRWIFSPFVLSRTCIIDDKHLSPILTLFNGFKKHVRPRRNHSYGIYKLSYCSESWDQSYFYDIHASDSASNNLVSLLPDHLLEPQASPFQYLSTRCFLPRK